MFLGLAQGHVASAVRLHQGVHPTDRLSFVYSFPDYSSVIIIEWTKDNMQFAKR